MRSEAILASVKVNGRERVLGVVERAQHYPVDGGLERDVFPVLREEHERCESRVAADRGLGEQPGTLQQHRDWPDPNCRTPRSLICIWTVAIRRLQCSVRGSKSDTASGRPPSDSFPPIPRSSGLRSSPAELESQDSPQREGSFYSPADLPLHDEVNASICGPLLVALLEVRFRVGWPYLSPRRPGMAEKLSFELASLFVDASLKGRKIAWHTDPLSMRLYR